MAEGQDLQLKLLLLGGVETGKTSILTRISEDKFNEEYISTIGVDFKTKIVDIGGKRTKLYIWDTAGMEKFRSPITHAQYRLVHGAMLVYDVTNEKSFSELPNWIDNVKKHAPEGAEIILLANKCDLEDERSVSEQQSQKFAIQNDLDLMYVSAKTGMNIEEVFMTLAQKIVAKVT